MPIIDPAPKEILDQPKIKQRIEKARALGVPDEMFFEIMAHAPGYAEALFDALYEPHAKGNVDHGLKEIIRIGLARLAGDGYSAAQRSALARQGGLTEEKIEAGLSDFETDPQFTDAEKWALRYGYLMYREPKKVNKEFYDQGKKYYSEAEIMEIGGLIAIHYGLQVFLSTLKLAPKGN
ncbi:MAG: carboxymuconolactone decarboxylase family protein [Rhodospirillales bacterium]|nr:carboxymuconolactone decarboxylase family protein [Rhodospirillales bacterium]